MSQPKIAHYQLVSRLGQGAMGVVFRARDERLERDVAIKLLQVSLDTSESADYAARLLQEARSAARLNHAGIITVYDCGEWEGKPYLAMELVHGVALKDILEKRGTLAIRDAVRIAEQMFAALAHAHEHDVVHRDIKPANLMLTKDGRLKITDFGIAQLPASDLTRTGTILGSPRYMSPEQLAGTKLDGRADIYSAGVVLYQALTGKVPFDGETTMNIVFNILHSQPVDPVALNPEIPPWLASLILRCVAKKREDRFAGAEEVVALIRAARSNPSVIQKPIDFAAEAPLEASHQAAVAANLVPGSAGSPLLSWLKQTAVTLKWIGQQFWQLLNCVAKHLWPWCLLAMAALKKSLPIIGAKLHLAWQTLLPYGVTAWLQLKRGFLALPKRGQAGVMVAGVVALTWLMWPTQQSEITEPALTWSEPNTQYQTEPSTKEVLQPDPSPAAPLVVTLPRQAPNIETESVVEPESVEPEIVEPKVEKKPKPKVQQPSQDSSLGGGIRRFGQSLDSAVTEAVNCFNGKAACPTPAPDLHENRRP